MSGKQELQKLVKTYTKAKKEAETIVNKAAQQVQQVRQEQTGQSSRPA